MTANIAWTARPRVRGVVRAAPAHALGLALSVAAATAIGSAGAADPMAPATVSYRVVADGIAEPLAAEAGDAARGRALLIARESANCVLCHALPERAVRFTGDLGPSLAGVGARLSVPQLRLRVADNLQLKPDTIMPSYFKVDGLERVASRYRGKPILDAREIEDVVAYLATLR